MYDCYPQRTFVGIEMEEFFEVIKGGANFKLSRPWVKYGDDLIVDTPLQ